MKPISKYDDVNVHDAKSFAMRLEKIILILLYLQALLLYMALSPNK